MRRKRQQLSNDESVAILEKATAGTLALLGDDVQPKKYTNKFGRLNILKSS